MTNPWDMLPEEPVLWFHRFELYRSLGPSRSIANASRLAAKLDPLKEYDENRRAGQDWYEAAKQWQWQERAEAFDLAEIEKARGLEEIEREKARAQRLSAYRGLLGKGWERVAQGLQDEGVAVRAVDLGAKGLRTEFGEPETIQKHRVELEFVEPKTMEELVEDLDE